MSNRQMFIAAVVFVSASCFLFLNENKIQADVSSKSSIFKILQLNVGEVIYGSASHTSGPCVIKEVNPTTSNEFILIVERQKDGLLFYIHSRTIDLVYYNPNQDKISDIRFTPRPPAWSHGIRSERDEEK